MVWGLELDTEILDEEAWKSLGDKGFDAPRFFGASHLTWPSPVETADAQHCIGRETAVAPGEHLAGVSTCPQTTASVPSEIHHDLVGANSAARLANLVDVIRIHFPAEHVGLSAIIRRSTERLAVPPHFDSCADCAFPS